MIVRICVLYLIIIKSEVWTISCSLELGHETMICAVCLAMFLWLNVIDNSWDLFFYQFVTIFQSIRNIPECCSLTEAYRYVITNQVNIGSGKCLVPNWQATNRHLNWCWHFDTNLTTETFWLIPGKTFKNVICKLFIILPWGRWVNLWYHHWGYTGQMHQLTVALNT